MKKIIIFGGSGFLGGHVADYLSKEGFRVTIFDIKESLFLREDQRFICGDITDKQSVEEAIKGHQIVYNFAGIADIDEAAGKPYETIYTNVLGNTHILEGCRQHNVERFLFASTIYVYSDLGSFYRSSKQACELIIENYYKKYGLNFTILRYGSLYGPRANERNPVYRFLKEALSEGKITRLGTGEEIREYIHVFDAAHFSVKALDPQYKNQYLLLSGHQQIRVKDLMLMIKEILGNKIELEFKDVEYEGHYNITPYNFSPKLAKKITDSSHVDLGQGLLDLLNDIYCQQRKQKQLKDNFQENLVSPSATSGEAVKQ